MQTKQPSTYKDNQKVVATNESRKVWSNCSETQIIKLGNFLAETFPEYNNKGELAVDCAIRIIKNMTGNLREKQIRIDSLETIIEQLKKDCP